MMTVMDIRFLLSNRNQRLFLEIPLTPHLRIRIRCLSGSCRPMERQCALSSSLLARDSLQ